MEAWLTRRRYVCDEIRQNRSASEGFRGRASWLPRRGGSAPDELV